MRKLGMRAEKILRAEPAWLQVARTLDNGCSVWIIDDYEYRSSPAL